MSTHPSTWERFKALNATTADICTNLTAFFALLAWSGVGVTKWQGNPSSTLKTVAIIAAVTLGVVVLVRLTAFGFRVVRFKATKTTVTLWGGHSLTLTIQRQGAPVKVGARVQFMEFGDEMAIHPAPYDLKLYTRVDGGRYDRVELNQKFDMATSVFGHLTKLAERASEFRVERPGAEDFMTVVQRTSSQIPWGTLAYLNVTVTVIAPDLGHLFGTTRIEKKHRLMVSNDEIEVIDDSAPKKKNPVKAGDDER